TTMLLYEARRLRLPVLYDLDDPLFSVSAYMTYENMRALPAARKAHFVREAPRYLDVLNAADIVSVSTPGLQEHTRLHTARPVYQRRNFADRQTLEAGRRILAHKVNGPRQKPGFRVGFASGSQGHEVDFALIQNDIIGFLEADPHRRLVILGHFDPKWLPVELTDRIERHEFLGYEAYLEVLASLDCAVMPLADDQFNRCKSAVRVLDAAAVAVPSLVGPVSDMAQVVKDSVTGRVIGSGESWVEALEALAGDPGAASALGRSARTEVETTWSAQLAPHLIDPEIIDWVCQ
ncbi:MAG: glycosyltransferase family 4 protein, partial [Rhodobacteraceae bacterium]|nr:glycosyltransferase family 4 protein [Paracoccaceae bacterium]